MGDVIVPNVSNSSYIELANTGGRQVSGRLFRKQILHEGHFIHPANAAKKVTIDRKFAESLVENFNAGACDIVQVPIVDDKNRHSEDPTRNIGEVVGLSYEPGVGVFADIDVRKYADDLGKTILGGSAMISLAYQDKVTGEVKTPVLLHVAATNRPYLTNLEGFKEVLAMSDTETDQEEIFFLSELEPSTGGAMSKDELIAALKEYGVDVPDLQRRAAAVDDIAALSNLIDPKDSTLTLSDLAQATVELDEKTVELTNQITAANEQVEAIRKERDELLLSAAEKEVDDLIADGRILPKAREKMIQLSVNDRETFDALVPDEAIVQLSENQTVTTFETPEGSDAEAVAEIDRYASMLAK